VGLSKFLNNLRLFNKQHSVKESCTYKEMVQAGKTHFAVLPTLETVGYIGLILGRKGTARCLQSSLEAIVSTALW